MSYRNSPDFKKVSFILIILILVGVIQFYVYEKNSIDGSFSEGVIPATEGWLTKTDLVGDLTFKYPASFDTTYIKNVDWPPSINVYEPPVNCNETGSEIARAGQTEKKQINGHTYCITKIAEGAAGSTYTQYAYAIEKGGKVLIFTFTTKVPQCGNYPDSEKFNCEDELKTFSIDRIVDLMARSVKYN